VVLTVVGFHQSQYQSIHSTSSQINDFGIANLLFLNVCMPYKTIFFTLDFLNTFKDIFTVVPKGFIQHY
jgi:hypothetical protein